MQSKKPIFKKEYEPVDHVEESVWRGNDTPIMETEYTYVFNDRYPCVEGHKLFIPRNYVQGRQSCGHTYTSYQDKIMMPNMKVA